MNFGRIFYCGQLFDTIFYHIGRRHGALFYVVSAAAHTGFFSTSEFLRGSVLSTIFCVEAL